MSQDCLRTVTTLPWPARSPDLSPIEHTWDHFGRRVGHPTSLNELEERCANFFLSMSVFVYTKKTPKDDSEIPDLIRLWKQYINCILQTSSKIYTIYTDGSRGDGRISGRLNSINFEELLLVILGTLEEIQDVHLGLCLGNTRLPSCALKVKSFESLCDLIISDKLFETLNKETATHIGIRGWFRPIDLAKECDIYISSKNGSRKETPITYGYTQDPFKNRSRNFKPEIKDNYPQYLERENKNCFICGDSSHYARDCEERFKPKESNDHIHNRKNVNTLKVESEKQNIDEFEQLQYVHIFVENQPVTALIDSGCQIPVLNSSLIRVNQPSEEIITLSSCFGEQRMVEVKPINISLNQLSPGLSVRTAISPTLTEEFIIHPSVYAEIKELGHAKSDVLLSESGSSFGCSF
ncbi:transposon Ty3-I Gag-Pol polyprotein [Trichonephila clavipes]|nr:transposon Ty3-I Gag-Pol polyprotein [Trichonephila clavipes]